MIQKLSDIFKGKADSDHICIAAITEQMHKINELIDAVNQLEGSSTESTTSDIRLIDADKVKAAIKETCDKYNITYGDGCGGFGEAIAKIVDAQPTIENPKSKTSKWDTFRVQGYLFPIQYICINCQSPSNYAYDYWPHCGARMNNSQH